MMTSRARFHREDKSHKPKIICGRLKSSGFLDCEGRLILLVNNSQALVEQRHLFVMLIEHVMRNETRNASERMIHAL